MDKIIKHVDGNIGGYLVGRRHSEGGIKAINKSTNQPLEMEGGEVVITRNAVSDNEKREFEGEMLTNKQILSRINEGGGGVSFEKGGEIHAYGNKYNYGGHLMSDHEILHTMAVGGEINELEYFDFENEEYALGGNLTSGLELTDLEGGAFIQSGNNYPSMKVINYNSFPIYVFVDYREKKQKTLQKPLKLTTEADGLIRVYEYQHVYAYLYNWVLIENVLNISKLYEHLDSKYVNSSAIVVCSYEFLDNKNRLQNRILNLLNEFSRYDDKRTSTRKGINKAIEEMDTYQNSYLKQSLDDFENTKIKRVYFTQDINWTNSAIPYTNFDVSSYIECFLIMHNRKQILNMLSRVRAYLTGKNQWNFFVIEFEDGRMRFDVLSLKQNQSPINFDDIIDTTTPRNEKTVTILTNSQYVNNSLSPDFIIKDSELADKQIKELPTTVSISLSTNNQTFQVGDSTQATQTPLTPMIPSANAGARVKLVIGEQDLQNQINDLTDLLNLIPEYDFEDKIAISQELTTLQEQMNVYVADSTIQNEFYNTGKIIKDQSVIDLMLSADCVKLSPRPTNTNLYQNGFNPNGKPTSLNKFNYDLIHTEQFQRWFGNYGLAYNYSKIGESNLGLSSQVVNSDGEPLIVYMGVGREFEKITFNRFPIGYFAVNEAYAEWFATTKGQDGVGYLLPFFLNIRRPLDFSMFGIDEVSPKDFFDWLYLETGMTGKELGFDDRWFLPNQPELKVWMYIRNCPNFLNKLKEYKICDGIHFYENNPSNPVGANNYMTEVWTIFYSNQCKLASQDRSEMILSANNSFLMKKGGLVK